MPLIGRYANGEPYGISPIRIVSETPAYEIGTFIDPDKNGGALQTGVAKHGMQVNAGIGGSGPQGFTDADNGQLRIPYDASINVATAKTGVPLDFLAGQEGSVIKAVTLDDTTPYQGSWQQNVLDAMGVFTVVAAAPPAGAFRPAVSAVSKTSTHTEFELPAPSTLPKFPLLGGEPSTTALVNALRWPSVHAWFGGDDTRSITARKNHPSGEYPPRSLGRDRVLAGLMLCMDIPDADKFDLMKVIAQNAIDTVSFISGRASGLDYGGIQGAGGLGGVVQRGWLPCLGIGGLLFNDAAMLEWADAAQHPNFGEDGQMKYIDQATIDQVQADLGGRSGRLDYEQFMLGAPEWSETNWFRHPTMGDMKPTATYRQIAGPYYVGLALLMHLFPGLKATLNRQVLLDYCDRLMERDFLPGHALNVNKLGRAWTGTDSVHPWILKMWDAHRTDAGNSPIWDWQP